MKIIARAINPIVAHAATNETLSNVWSQELNTIRD
jgi:hypothetical protein